MSEAKSASSLRVHQRLGFLLVLLLFGGVGGWVALASISALLLLRLHWGIPAVLAVASALGVAVRFSGL